MTAASARTLPTSWLPEAGAWGMVACVLIAGFLVNWVVAAGVAAFLLIQLARPFDFLAAALLVVGGSTFLDYQKGNLTVQFSLLSATIVFMLFCYARSRPGEIFSVCRSDLTGPLGLFLVLSALNAARGFVAGNPHKAILLEFMPVLAIGSGFVIASAFDAGRHVRLAIGPLIGIAWGSAGLGYHAFSILRTHMSGVFFQPVPGMVALLLFNLALRAKSAASSLGWVALSLPLFLHQFLSYRRGLWLGSLAGLVVSILIFAMASGSGGRWRRCALVGGVLLGTGIAGAGVLALLYGQADILQEAGGRFASIGSTENKIETYSNIARLMEYAVVAEHIRMAPWFGHGLGFSFDVQNPQETGPGLQWWVHQNYLLVWLKQGVVGLAVFLWMLWAAFWMSAREARRRMDPYDSGWLAAAAASTAFMAVFSMADFPFDSAESMFFLALMWGGSMAMASRGRLRVRWHAAERSPEPGPHLAPSGTP